MADVPALTRGTYFLKICKKTSVFSNHLQALSKNIFISADNAFSALEIIYFLLNGLYECNF